MLQREINRDYYKLKDLLKEGKDVRELCSASEFQGIQKSMDEINSRYQQVLQLAFYALFNHFQPK